MHAVRKARRSVLDDVERLIERVEAFPSPLKTLDRLRASRQDSQKCVFRADTAYTLKDEDSLVRKDNQSGSLS